MPVWTALFAYIALREKLKIYDFISMFLTFLGVLLINRPWETNLFAPGSQFTKMDIFIGTVFSITGAWGASAAFVCMRFMKNIHYSISPFWFATGCTFFSPIGSLGMMMAKPQTVIYTWEIIGLITAASVASFFGQVFQSRAYQLEKASRVAAVNYLQIVTSFLWDLLYFKSTLHWLDIVGCVLIVGTILLVVILKAFNVIK